MSRSNSTDTNMTRNDLAACLEQLARQLRDGEFKHEENTWSVPENLSAIVNIKEKRGRIQTKIKWQWSTFEEYD